MDSRTIIRLIEAEGWEFRSQKGSHAQFKHPTRPGRTTVPHPLKDVTKKTIISIEKQSGVRLRRRK
ncbi:MAG: type II toxin-antitoxin system HicA family toxin [Sphingomonadaceae bacterium]